MDWEMNFIEWLATINQNTSFDWLSNFFKFFSLISEVGIIWIIAMIIFLAIKKTRKLGFSLAFALFFFAIFIGAVMLKLVFQRLRPLYASEDLLSCTSKWFEATGSEPFDLWCIPARNSYSFASTRAFTGFMCATIMFFFNKKIGAGAYIVAALCSFSRIYFGFVYPTDTIAGALLGAGFGVLTIFLTYKFYDKIAKFFDNIFTEKEAKK